MRRPSAETKRARLRRQGKKSSSWGTSIEKKAATVAPQMLNSG
jgi:hypothetical protein